MDLDLPKYALTLHWPWCEAIVNGPKRVENRTFRPGEATYGERIAIHCGKTEDKRAATSIAHDPDIDWHPEDGRAFDEVAGCIVGTARVVGWIDEEPPGSAKLIEVPSHLEGELKGTAVPRSESLTRMHQSEWFQGPVGWILDDVEALEPVPARGRPGFWVVEKQVVEPEEGEPKPENAQQRLV